MAASSTVVEDILGALPAGSGGKGFMETIRGMRPALHLRYDAAMPTDGSNTCAQKT